MLSLTAPILIIGFTVLFSYKFVSNNPFNIVLNNPHNSSQENPHSYPVGAIEYIKRHKLSGNILPEFDWGEFLLFTLSPDSRVAMDGRYETVYKTEICLDYFDFINGRKRWRKFLKAYNHDMILIRPLTVIHSLIQREPTWQQIYSDNGCVLFLRADYNTRKDIGSKQ